MNHAPRISISSPPDREHLVAEIFIGDVQWAEINQEGEELEVEIYPRRDGEPWRFAFTEMMAMLNDASRRLLSRGADGQS